MKKVYVASRASLPERVEMWRGLRQRGLQVTSGWIDKPDENGADFAVMWQDIVRDVKCSDALLMYCEADDFPLRGVYVEVGIALAENIPVLVVLPNVDLQGPSLRPLGAWAYHPLVTRYDSLSEALVALGYNDFQDV